MFDVSAVWDLPSGTDVRPMNHGGTNNMLYDVHAPDARRFVLRVYGNHANPSFIQHELSVLFQLQSLNLPFQVPAPIPTRAGSLYALGADRGLRRLMVLLPHIAGSNPSPDDLATCAVAGETLANLGDALRKVKAHGHPMPASYLDLGRIHPLVHDPAEGVDWLPISKRMKARLKAVLESVVEDAAPIFKRQAKQLIHGDYIPGNVLMDGGRVTGVLDFEFCAMNPPVMDVAVALDTWGWTLLDSDARWRRYDAFGRGFARVRRLTADEAGALPTLILLRNCVVLMHVIGGFMADKSQMVDVEYWIESTLTIDAWLTLYGKQLVERAQAW